MGQMVDQIAKHLPTSNDQIKKELEQRVEALKEMSDMILDEWIQFEEKMSEKIGHHFPTILIQSTIKDFENYLNMDKTSSDNLSTEKIDNKIIGNITVAKEEFYKGKGYFDLGLFNKSYDIFKQIILEDPDYEFARLYFAYSALFSENKEEALHHFSLLVKSSANSKIRAVCLNAMGIIHFEELLYEGANRYFEQAIKEDHNLHVAYYNLGMTLYTEGNYKEAIQKWETYLELTHDPDVDLIFYLSNSYLRLGQYSAAMDIVRIMLPQNHEQILLQLGKFFEDVDQFEDAIKCYKSIVSQNPVNSEALHGIGWNQWLLNNDDEQIVPLLKKALSLDKDNQNIHFSLAWIYFHQNNIEEAEKTTLWLLQKNNHSPLAISLSFLLALQKGDQRLAEERIQLLQEEKDQRNRALAEMFMGKLKLKQNLLLEALESFKKSVWNNPQLKENYVLQGFAYYLSQDNERAEAILKKQQSVTFLK